MRKLYGQDKAGLRECSAIPKVLGKGAIAT